MTTVMKMPQVGWWAGNALPLILLILANLAEAPRSGKAERRDGV